MNHNGEYERLRAWYLARLRRLSLQNEAELELTPAGLISADRENIERIILESKDQQSDKSPLASSTGIEVLSNLFVLCLSGLFYLYLDPAAFLTVNPYALCFCASGLLLLCEPLITSKSKTP